jgi:hypothetical protein
MAPAAEQMAPAAEQMAPAAEQAVSDPNAVGGAGDAPGVADRLQAPDQGAAADES